MEQRPDQPRRTVIDRQGVVELGAVDTAHMQPAIELQKKKSLVDCITESAILCYR